MIDIDTTDRNEQRKFGLVMGAAVAVLGLARWALHSFEGFPVYFMAVAAVLAGIGLLSPRILQPFFYAWIRFALVLNWIMTRVFLGIAFYLLMTPTAIIRRFFADDPLQRQWKAPGESYWEEPEEQPEEFDRYRQQF